MAKPTVLQFKDPTHIDIGWFNADFGFPESVLFSPEEQAARSESQPGTIYWMSRSMSGSTDIVRIGFTSPVCEDLDAILQEKYCWTFSRERQSLVAELTCKQERLPAR
jgi:hypothetical protein